MASSVDTRQLENVCRLCLTDASEAGHMVPIFPVRGGNPNSPTSMVNRIFQCTSLKLEPKDGIPATICELCTVRLEDWYAFREQCLGSDEYLRVALGPVYCGDSCSTVQIHHQPVQYAGQQQSHHAAPHPDGSRFSSLAKRRKSTFEWALTDGKGNSTDQKVIVEVLVGDGAADSETTATRDGGVGFVEQQGGGGADQTIASRQPSYEPIPLTDEGDGGGRAVIPPDMVAGPLVEEATWSKEYCARVNSLMVMVNGVRPFKCKICRKLFKSRSNLRRHIKVNHADEVFEGESPPPECYDYGHIQRVGGMAAEERQPFAPEQQQQLLGLNNQHPHEGAIPVKRKRRSASDPPITGPYKCHVCPRSFKMAAHLAVHMKTHQRVTEEAPPNGLELQLQQQLLLQQHQQQVEGARTDSRRSSVVSRKTDIEPSDIIQLSDDDDDAHLDDAVNGDIKGFPRKQEDRTSPTGNGYALQNGVGNELDDGFSEEDEQGSLKASILAATSDERTSVADSKQDIVKKKENVNDDVDDDDEVVMVVQEEKIAPVPTIAAEPVVVPKPRRIPAPGTIPPGPLSMKQRYRASMENGGVIPTKDLPSVAPSQQTQLPFNVARPKHSPVNSATPPLPSVLPPVATVEMSAVDPTQSAGESSPPTNGALPVVHRCHFCQQTFAREEQLRVHQKIHQRDAPFPFRCRWCQKGFRYRQNYTLHVEKQTCRLLSGDAGNGVKPAPPAMLAGGTPVPAAAPTAVAVANRPIVANKRAW